VARHAENISTIQGDLFQQLEQPPLYRAESAPDLDIEAELMGALAYCLREAKRHGLSRERVVDRINLCLPEDKHITLRQLNAWCAASKEHHPLPAKVLPALVWAVGGLVSPVEVITRALGLALLDEEEQIATELGRTVAARAELAIRERQLTKRLKP